MSQKIARTDILFHDARGSESRGRLSLEGVEISDPSKIKELMDLLRLPEGTNATILAQTSTTIVR